MSDKNKKALILFGPPGSGKTSIANKLLSNDNTKVIQTGQLLRDEINQNTELGEKLKTYLNDGKLAPTDLVVKAVNKEIEKLSFSKIIFDGSPRTREEIEPFLKMLEENNITISTIVILYLEFDTVYKRITGRRVCPNGKIYNVYYNPPEVKGVCDVCGQNLEQRNDDKSQIVEKRFDEYKKNTMPVVQQFRKKYADKNLEVDAEKSIDEISNQIEFV